MYSYTTVFSQNELPLYKDSIKEHHYATYRYTSLRAHVGKHFYTGNTLDKELNTGYRSLDLRLGLQNSDPEHWTNKYYNSTSYGIGFYAAYVGNTHVLGVPTAVYGFVSFPYGNLSKRTTFTTNGALGITYDSNYYHEQKNPSNDALGSAFSIYVNIGFGIETIVTRNIDIVYGLDYTHFSNGRMVVPNYGLNMLGLNLGFKYHYNQNAKKTSSDVSSKNIVPARFRKNKSERPPRNIKQNINILTSFGVVQNGNYESVDKGASSDKYYVFSGYVEYQLKINVKHGIDTGFDLFYDDSLITIYHDSNDRYLYGYHLGYNYSFGKMLLKVDFGGYLGPYGNKEKDDLWARAALQYRILNWMSIHLGLKTKQGFTADWPEIGVAFQPFEW
tara:strand:+ start:39400 stop:40563 length:1164 start_codon:yes stop_codon:yes gene_type:complete